MTVPGAVIAGRYRLITAIASGGMGAVWEAWDEVLQRRVAVKQLLLQPGLHEPDAATARDRVIREARITARLHHPHAVAIFDVVEHGGLPCLIMQYVPSRSLQSLLQDNATLEPLVVARIGGQLAAALAAAHDAGIVHRDVKPSNVLITPDGAALLTDFGIAHANGDVTLTATGMVTGTPAFLAPEVARGEPSSFPADVFSLGATLYAALEGAPPFGTDPNPMAILHKVASEPVIPPRRSGVLTSLITWMLARAAADRPSMKDVAHVLAGLDPAASARRTAEVVTVGLPPSAAQERPTDRSTDEEQHFWTGAPLVSPPRATGSRRRLIGGLLATILAIVLAGAILLEPRLFGHAPIATGGAPTTAPSGAGTAALTTVTAGRTVTPTSAVQAPASSPHASTPAFSSTTAPTATSAATRAVRSTSASRKPRSSSSLPSTAPTTSSASQAPSTIATAASTTTSAAPRTATTTSPPPPSTSDPAQAITAYYALLPTDTDQGWAHLSARFQNGTAVDRQYYQQFWDKFQRVTATAVHATGPDTVRATITYYFKDGRITVEPTEYTLVQDGGITKIDTSTIISSETL